MADEKEVVAAEPAAERLVVAKAGRYYRVARYLMTLLLMGYGGWSIYDGFVSWPDWPISHPREKPKTDTDIMLNKVLGVLLPPMGLFVLGWAVFNSRGEYRMEDGVLKVPGHPPVPLDKIHSINREMWDRKGIAYVDYDLTNPTARGTEASDAGKGTFKLDDFVYEREPTDKIFKAIESSLLKGVVSAPVSPAKTTAPAASAKAPPRPRTGSNL